LTTGEEKLPIEGASMLALPGNYFTQKLKLNNVYQAILEPLVHVGLRAVSEALLERKNKFKISIMSFQPQALEP